MLKDYRLPPPGGAPPESAVIFLHGLGDSGNGGLLSIAEIWQRAMPMTEFLCPDAPFPFDMAPQGGGRQWFGYQNVEPGNIDAGIRHAAPILNDYIDHVLKTRNLPPSKLVLAGFSQGAMMALHVTPRRAEPLAGVLAYSGLLSNGEALVAEKKSSPPVLLIHGAYDDIVPYSRMAEAMRGLSKAGIPVAMVTCPDVAHSIDNRGVIEGLKFLTDKLFGMS